MELDKVCKYIFVCAGVPLRIEHLDYVGLYLFVFGLFVFGVQCTRQ